MNTRLPGQDRPSFLPPRSASGRNLLLLPCFPAPRGKICALPSKILGGVSNRVQPPCTRNVVHAAGTRTNPRMHSVCLASSPSPTGTRSHRLFNARDNPPPLSTAPCHGGSGYLHTRLVARQTNSTSRRIVYTGSYKTVCAQILLSATVSDNIHGNILVKQKKCTCIYIYIASLKLLKLIFELSCEFCIYEINGRIDRFFFLE